LLLSSSVSLPLPSVSVSVSGVIRRVAEPVPSTVTSGLSASPSRTTTPDSAICTSAPLGFVNVAVPVMP
jgi:hypothetical protein